MANYSVLKAAVQAVVKTNGNQEITGANMQSTLISIINSLGTGYQFMGVATPSTSPGTPDYNVAYIGGAGTYANFGTSVTVPVGSIGVFKYNGSWTSEQVYTGGKQFIHGRGGIVQLYLENTDAVALRYIRRNYNGKWAVALDNASSVGVATTKEYTSEQEATGVLPLYVSGGSSVVVGYIIIDWTQFNTGQTFGGDIDSIAYDLSESPTIYSYLNKEVTDLSISNLKNEAYSYFSTIPLGDGYLPYIPTIEAGTLSKYGVKGDTDGYYRMVLPVSFKNGKRIKITPSSSSVSYQIVFQVKAEYGQSNNTVPRYGLITTGQTTEIDINDTMFFALAWRDRNNLTATAQQAIEVIKIEVYTEYANADLLNSISEKFSYKTSKNLFDVSTQVIGYLDASGNLVEDNNFRTSALISVAGISNIIITYSTSNGIRYYSDVAIFEYNSSGGFIRRATTAAHSYAPQTGVAYIRIYYRYYSSHDMALMIEAGTLPTQYERYYKRTLINNSDLKKVVNYERDQSKLQIVCWGDSLTYGQGSTSYPYPTKLAELIQNAEIVNFGVPGEKTIAIASRQNSFPILLSPITIPSDTSSVIADLKNVYGENFTTLGHNGWGRTVDVYSATVNGENILLTYSNGNYYIRREIAIGSETSITRPTNIQMYGLHYREWLPIIWAGTNDAPNSNNSQQVINEIKQMVEYAASDNYLILGLTHQGSEPEYKTIFNNLLAQTFGTHFINVLEYLKNYGLEDNNLTPTAQDTTDIANNVVPTSLRSDSVHLNDYGYIAVANCVYNYGKQLGYWL